MSAELDRLDCGGLFSRARRHRLDCLARAAERRGRRRREVHIQEVIASSPYLRDLWRDDPATAGRTAIQTSRRAPAENDPALIGAAERQAAARVRQHLDELAWTHHDPRALRALIEQRSLADRMRRDRAYFVRHLARRFAIRMGDHRPYIGALARRAASAEILAHYHGCGAGPTGDGGGSAAPERLLAAVCSADERPLTIVHFACLRLDPGALGSGDPAAVVSTAHIQTIARTRRRIVRRLIADLRATGVRVQLLVVFADSDLQDYILPALLPTCEPDRALLGRVAEQVAHFRQHHRTWLDQVGGAVVTWTELVTGRARPGVSSDHRPSWSGLW
ncbi:MAG: hypothetical protein AAGC55_30690, partial [Myxococcota bacterium]